MTPADYIKKALRTENKTYPYEGYNGVTPRIEHAVYGIVTEAGELMADLKKTKIYSKPLDRDHLIDEMGDVMWYMALLADELGVGFEEVWEKNIKKLLVRYPEGYDSQKALNHDKEQERKAMNSNV